MKNVTLYLRTWREVRNFAWHRLRSHFIVASQSDGNLAFTMHAVCLC